MFNTQPPIRGDHEVDCTNMTHAKSWSTKLELVDSPSFGVSEGKNSDREEIGTAVTTDDTEVP